MLGVWLTKVESPLEFSSSSALLLAGSCVPSGVQAPAAFLPWEMMTTGMFPAMVTPGGEADGEADSTLRVPGEHNAKEAFAGAGLGEQPLP